jgi:hypothetical protein
MKQKERMESEILDTKDLNAIRYAAGKLNEPDGDAPKGLTFTITGIDTKKATQTNEATGRDEEKDFYILSGFNEENQLVNLAYSSQKLQSMITQHWDRLLNHKVRIDGRGKDFAREYSITFIKTDIEKKLDKANQASKSKF